MMSFNLPLVVIIHSLLGFMASSIFFYQVLTSYISYHAYRVPYGKHLILLCTLCGLSCLGNGIFPYVESDSAKSFLTHYLFALAYGSAYAYVRLMKVYLNRDNRFLRFSEYIILISVICLTLATLWSALGNSTFLLHRAPYVSRSVYVTTLNNPYTPTSIATAMVGVAFVAMLHHYVFFLGKLWTLRKREPLLLLGTIVNFLLVSNDVSLVTSAFAYTFPIVSFSFFLEALRITSVIQQQSYLKVNELEGEIIQIAQVAELGFLAGNISHDIRNPLALAAGCSFRLRRHLTAALPHDDKWPVLVEKLDKACLRMEKIIESYLFLLHKDSGQQEVTPVNWRMIIAEALALCEPRMGELPGLKLEVDNSHDLLMPGHDTQLIMILVNLINNACDAIAPLPEQWIKITATTHGEAYEVRVTDSGKGIPEAVRRHIFDKRFTTKKRGKGLGLGLDFVKRVVEAHGGHITVDPQSPHTSFVLSFPHPEARSLRKVS